MNEIIIIVVKNAKNDAHLYCMSEGGYGIIIVEVTAISESDPLLQWPRIEDVARVFA